MKRTFFALLIFFSSFAVFAQTQVQGVATGAAPLTFGKSASAGAGTELPLKKASLFSSGVGYFRHSGVVPVSVSITLPFNDFAVNDALKSLVINDSEAANPQVNYPSENTILRTLQSLKIDLSGNPGIADILSNLTGAEIQVSTPATVVTPNSFRGRIVAVESGLIRYTGEAAAPAVTLSTASGIRIINVKDIQSLTFTDPVINADLSRALDLLAANSGSGTRHITVDLVGKNRRNVDISYVIPTPVWKVSYRLDLNQNKPFLQGWAIIDNDGDTDWVDVELSLVTGRPVSFIQNLYPPYYVNRPTLPLSIAGIAQARTHESAYGIFANDSEADRAYSMADGVYESAPAAATAMRTKSSNNLAYAPAPAPLTGGVINTAAGASAGDQFEFTLKKPVTLARQQSAMLPLVEGAVTAVKALVFSGAKAVYGNAIHPEISAELTNNTGMKLPAGPITVFDGGTYAGDALLEFLPENEKRLISYGEDLSVSGNTTNEVNRPVTSVKISKGTMTINRSVSNEKTYIIKNASYQSKSLIIEHTKTNGATLKEPAKSDEETSALYRFKRPLAANATITFTVKEESPVVQQITLGRLNIDSFASYSTSGEMPENVRAAFSKAIALKNAADDQQKTLADLTARRERLLDDETRIRANIEAAGNTSEQGIQYLTRLAAIDTEIDAQTEQIDTRRAAAEKAKTDYDNYISSLEL